MKDTSMVGNVGHSVHSSKEMRIQLRKGATMKAEQTCKLIKRCIIRLEEFKLKVITGVQVTQTQNKSLHACLGFVTGHASLMP